jgi:hypothetical protein
MFFPNFRQKKESRRGRNRDDRGPVEDTSKRYAGKDPHL